MLDVLLINPAAYRGRPRRGPYELTTLREILLRAGLRAEIADIQEAVGRGTLPFPVDHVSKTATYLSDHQALLVFITLRTTGGPWAVELARVYRRLYPDSAIVAFAPRIEERVHRFLHRNHTFDALCIARAEDIIVELAEEVRSNGIAGLSRTRGLLTRLADGRICTTSSPSQVTKMDDVPGSSPWISLDGSVAAVHVGRGCPDRCTFCAAHLGVGAKPQYIYAARIAREAEEAFALLNPKMPRFVMLETENLTSNRRLVEAIAQERARRGFIFRWGAYGRIDHMDPPMRTLLREAGCTFLFFGMETGSTRMQKVLGKRFDLNGALRSLRALHAEGFMTQSSFMFAFPGERWEDFVATAQLMANIIWAGGCVDWTPLRIEASTPMERMVKNHPIRILTNSELYVDLAEAGIVPESIDPDIGYRMYALDLPSFNTDLAYRIAQSWRKLLLDTPLTLYAIHAGLGQPVAAMLLSLEGVIAASGLLFNWLENEIDAAAPSAQQFLRDLSCYEIGTAKGPLRSRYNIDLLYQSLRRDPDLMPRVFSLDWWSSTAGQPRSVAQMEPTL
jgi:radical SAM superfamily enzyme YgiQ (UPF0313 family)